ncbi:MAG TPA: hypothetical protein VMK84_06745 [Streptosporangiaceae bacterium]|nr:hypothetical protein [Streptosporangiaceae bacterium]
MQPAQVAGPVLGPNRVNSGTINRAGLDGSNPQTLGSSQGAWGLAVSPVVRVV